MKTDDLIDALAAGLEPARPAGLNPLLLLCAAALSVAAVHLVLGVRLAPADIFASPVIWMKGAYTLSIAAGALWLSLRLGRPGAGIKGPLLVLGGAVGTAFLLGGIELATAPSGERLADLLGESWTICGRNILIISAAAVIPTFLSARRMAPTRPSLSGLALGVGAAAIAATAYGMLHCPESTAAFVAIWYTSGVAVVGAVGALAGRFTLRW